MNNKDLVDSTFGELLHAVDQFYQNSDKDDVSRTVSIARERYLSALTADDMQKVIGMLNSLNFVNTPYCMNARERLIKAISY